MISSEDIDDELSANSRVQTVGARGDDAADSDNLHGIVGSDGVLISVSATGHIDLEELHAHQKSLHTALYADPNILIELEMEYQREFDDIGEHTPFSHAGAHHHHILDLEEMEPTDKDHYDFHHEEEEATKLLLKGIEIAQQQNDAGLVHLYRGQKMFLDGNLADAAVQLENCIEYYRHLHLSDVGNEGGSKNGSSTSGSRNFKNKKVAKREVKYGEEEQDGDKDRLDFCPHIYSILVEVYYNMEHFHRATSVAREWVTKYPKNISPYCSLAWVQMKQLQFTDSINTCTAAIKKLPETEGMMSLYSIRGTCKQLLEQHEEAVQDFKYVKEMAKKNLARFAPEKPVFFKVEKAPRPAFPGFVPKSRPDIAMRKQTMMMRNCMGVRTPLKAEPKPGPSTSTIAVNNLRNYVVNEDKKRWCAKCSGGKRDPVTKLSVTKMRMGLSTDERRGASPSRLLLNANNGLFY